MLLVVVETFLVCLLDFSAHIQKSKGPPDEVNVSILSQQNVDRFAVLLDLWTSEMEFLERKLKARNTKPYFTS